MYVVYGIDILGVMKYVGMTNNIKRRQYEHRRMVSKSDKELYTMMRLSKEEPTLYILKEFEKKIDAVRFEAWLILDGYYNDRGLLNDLPKGIRYY